MCTCVCLYVCVQLGSLPIDPLLLRACEKGIDFVGEHPDAPAAAAFTSMTNNVLNATPALQHTKKELDDRMAQEERESAT